MSSEIDRKGWLNAISNEISLYDSFLDLIDNAIDTVSEANRNSDTFDGYKIEIKVVGNDLYIANNAEGMSISTLRKAFTAYSKYNKKKMIGVLDIGLQRALHKLGKAFEIKTWQKEKQHGTGIVDRETMEEGSLPIYTSKVDKKENGNEIVVFYLHKNLKDKLKEYNNLAKDLGLRYGKFIENGLIIKFSGNDITAINLKPENKVSKYKTDIFKVMKKEYNKFYEDWRAVIEVGGLPKNTKEEIDSDWDKNRKNGGWYVFFNGRCILLADQTEKTGWGYEGATRFHPQYNDFLGIVNIESEKTASLPFDSAKSNVRFDNEGYKKLILELIKYNKEWAKFTGKGGKTEPIEPKPPRKKKGLFPERWGNPEADFSDCFAQAVEEGKKFKNWKEYKLASIALTRIALELALRHVIHALDKEIDLYTLIEPQTLSEKKRNLGIQGLIGVYNSIKGLNSSETRERTSIANAVKTFNKQLNAYMHEGFEIPGVAETKDIIDKISPFMNYATRLKYD